MFQLGGLLALLLLLGCVFGWVSLFKTRQLREEVDQLKRQVAKLSVQPKAKDLASHRNEAASNAADAAITPTPEPAKPLYAERLQQVSKKADPVNPFAKPPASESQPFPSMEKLETPDWLKTAADHLQQHWMIWLGGICVALAGVFMVRYSIETGLLGPVARIVLAILTGLGLHGAAEWLRRRAGAHPAFAALAGGASITLYAALLAAMHLYQLLTPGTVFVLLAVVSIVTMMLAIQHGPVLAILGILGAYTVPVLVSTGSGNIAAALVYALIITASALWLMIRVYRSWLWLGTIGGAMAWWFISLSMGSADSLRGPYLTVLAYGLLAMPQFDWALSKATNEFKSWQDYALNAGDWLASDRFTQAPVALGLLLIIAAQAMSITLEGFLEPRALASALTSWLPLTLVLLIAARKNPVLNVLPWLAMLSQMAALVLITALQGEGGATWPLRLETVSQAAFCQYAIILAALHFLFAAWHLRREANSSLWAALMLLSPLLWLAISYSLTDALALTWQWSLIAVVFGIIYLAVARNRLSQEWQGEGRDQLAIWLILAGHFAYSLAAVILFQEATLTVAIAAQAVSLAWVIRRFNAPELGWLLKLTLAAVVMRLTFNPWLLTYSGNAHWSLYAYGGATLLCAVATWLLAAHHKLRAWLEAVTLHLFVLTLWAEARYWLYDGQIFSEQYGFIEAAINANAWGALGLVYYWRSRVSNHLKHFYQLSGHVLIVLALVNYWLLISLLNPLWGNASLGYGGADSELIVSGRPVFNLLLLAYGMPVLLGIIAFLKPKSSTAFRQLAAMFVGIAAFIFINLQIRHLWHGGLDIRDAMRDGELYTYSVVWLVIAVFTLLFGSSRHHTTIYRMGIGMLAAVIAKLFLIDMSGLEGMLRVASFMGLGLSLLGLGYLLQQASGSGKKQSTAEL